MTFNDNVRLDTSQVQDGGSGGGGFGGGLGGGGGFPGGIRVGGGIGGLIVLVLMLMFGGGQILGGGSDTSGSSRAIDSSQVGAAGQVPSGAIDQCRTGADANRNDVCLIVATVNSVQNYWNKAFPGLGMKYQPAKTVIYQGRTQSGCGTASNQVGPFYCPLDKKVYIDADFFKLLTQRFGADSGQLAKEYVVAHEYGHHVQDLLGLLGESQKDPQGAQSGAVRVELMADCFAGVWVKHATETKDADGTSFLKPVTESDIRSALSAAAAVGDDQIQQKTQGRVTPENWTHGSAQMRQRWFLEGFESGDPNRCDTLSAADLN